MNWLFLFHNIHFDSGQSTLNALNLDIGLCKN